LDVYALYVLDAPTPLFAQVFGDDGLSFPGSSSRVLYLGYICPDGDSGIEQCTGWEEEIQGVEVCISEEPAVGIERRCEFESGSQSELGIVLVGVQGNGFEDACDPYQLNIFASYQSAPPLGL
jgi:hypothetical protein